MAAPPCTLRAAWLLVPPLPVRPQGLPKGILSDLIKSKTAVKEEIDLRKPGSNIDLRYKANELRASDYAPVPLCPTMPVQLKKKQLLP